MNQPKNKVIGARCQSGVQVGHIVVNSLILGRNCTHMELSPVGLYVEQHLKTEMKTYLIPYANIQSIELEASGQEAA